MKPQKVIKLCKIVSLTFIAVSIIEIIMFISLNLTEINLHGDKMTISQMLMDSEITPPSGALLWVFLLCTIIFYLVLGVTLFITTLRPNLEQLSNAKRVVIIGMFILILSFVRLAYMVFLQKTLITVDKDALTFQSILYSSSITPFSAAVIWIFFTSVMCAYLIIGLFVSAFGLKITIETEKLIAEKRAEREKRQK